MEWKSIRNRDHSRPGSSRFGSERPGSAKRIENGMIVKYLAEGRKLKLTQMGRQIKLTHFIPQIRNRVSSMRFL